MEQLNLPIKTFNGIRLPESDYYGAVSVIMTDDINSIEFYPDYCAHGIWITQKSKKDTPYGHCHVDVSFDELELQFPLWFKNKVKAMARMFDLFADSGCHEEDYGFTFDDDDNFLDKCNRIIELDFIRLFPELAHLLRSTVGRFKVL
jgi:hypothetical protein